VRQERLEASGKIPSRLGSLRSGPLGVRSFRLLAGGQFTSTVGDYCYAVALPWLVLSNGGGAVLLGTVLACYGVPRTALIPVGGVLADKVGPRTVMLAADAGRCGARRRPGLRSDEGATREGGAVQGDGEVGGARRRAGQAERPGGEREGGAGGVNNVPFGQKRKRAAVECGGDVRYGGAR